MTKTLGITLTYGTAGESPATSLGKIVSIGTLYNMVFDEFDKSRVDQTSLLKQWAMTLADGGTFSAVLELEDGRMADLIALADGVDRAWGIAFADITDTIVITGPLKRHGVEGGGGTNTETTVPIEVRINDIDIVEET